MVLGMPGSLQAFKYVVPRLGVLAVVLLGGSNAQDLVIEPSPIHQGSTCSDIVSWLHPGATGPMVVQEVTNNYVMIEKNFIAAMTDNSRLTKENLFLLCLDEGSKVAMEGISVRGVLVNDVHSGHGRWRLRVHVMACLVEYGLDVIVSDSDAVWLGDPIPDMLAIEADVYASRAPWPEQYADPVHGNTACMGFIMFKAGTEGVHKFLGVVEEYVQDIGDDQIGVNKAISTLGPVYDYDEAKSDMRLYNSTGVGKAVLTGVPGNLTLALLPHNKYTRHCEITAIGNQTIVAHCHPPTPKGGGPPGKKEQLLKTWGLWRLK